MTVPATRHGLLGKKAPVRLDMPDFRVYFAEALPPPPPQVHYGGRVTVPWKMLANGPDSSVTLPGVPPGWGGCGDCVVAGMAHSLTIANFEEGKVTDSVPSANTCVETYCELGGCTPAELFSDPGDYDNGLDIANSLGAWHKSGLFGVKLGAYVPVDYTNLNDVKNALYLGGVVVIGIQVQEAQEEQFPHTWRWVPGSPVLGGHCVAPETRVLRDDLQWVAIGDLEEGDGLVAFDEDIPGPRLRRRFRRGVVEAVVPMKLPCYDLEFEDGTQIRASYDHRWLAGHTGSGGRQPGKGMNWLTTEQLRPTGPSGNYGSSISKVLPTWDSESGWKAGYLAGAFDGEGWIDGNQRNLNKLGFAQRDNEMLDVTRRLLKEFSFVTSQMLDHSGFGSDDCHRLTILGGRREVVRFLGALRPPRLLAKFHPGRLGAMGGDHIRLTRKTFVGEQEVVALQTDSRTFISEGLASHNCIILTGYTSAEKLFWGVTWGALIDMTEDFLENAMDEAFAVVSAQAIKDGKGPTGLLIPALEADLSKL